MEEQNASANKEKPTPNHERINRTTRATPLYDLDDDYGARTAFSKHIWTRLVQAKRFGLSSFSRALVPALPRRRSALLDEPDLAGRA
jgi:hypothetical protein